MNPSTPSAREASSARTAAATDSDPARRSGAPASGRCASLGGGASGYVGEDFAALAVDGLRVSVSPNGWRVARRGRLLASGRETGKAGFRLAMRAVGGGT
jgi:hypothetical protein